MGLESGVSHEHRNGPVKDADRKEHPCFVPYDELPADQKAKDYMFCGIVEAFFRASLLGAAAA